MTKGKTIDMLGGSLAKNMIRFALPILLMGIMQQLFIACDDMAILGIFVGDTALAAVGGTACLINLFVNTFTGFSVGANVVAAQHIGAEDGERTSKTVHTSIALSLILGLVLVIVGVSSSESLLILLKTPSDIVEMSTLYLQIYYFSTPATLIFSFGSAILNAKGNSRSPFLYLTISGCSDVVLNLFFVLVCGMDVDGVALGTVLSQCLSAILIIQKLMRETDACKLQWRKLKIDLPSLKKVLKIGVPAGVNCMVFSISNMLIQGAINSFGSLAVAGCSASATVENFVYTSVCAVSTTATSFTGQNYGAGRYDRIPKIIKWGLLYGTVIATVLGGALLLVGKPLLSLFLKEQESIDFAMLRSTILFLPYAVCAVMDQLPGIMRGMGRPIAPMIVALSGACIFRIIWLYTIFAAYPTPTVLFLGFPVSWTITAIAHSICLAVAMKKLRKSARAQAECD